MNNNVVFYLQKGQVQGFVKAEKPRLLPCRESLWWVEIGAQARDFLRSSLNFAAPAAGGRAGPPNDNHGVVDRGPTTTRGTPASPTSLTSIFRLEAALCAGYPHNLDFQPQAVLTTLPLRLANPVQSSNSHTHHVFPGIRPSSAHLGREDCRRRGRDEVDYRHAKQVRAHARTPFSHFSPASAKKEGKNIG